MLQLSRSDFITHLGRLLRPVVRFALRNGGTIQDLTECLKLALVEAAQDQISVGGDAVTASRVSVLTGLHRRDIARLAKHETKFAGTGNVATKIVGQWSGQPQYRDRAKQPRTLSCGAEDSEFNSLCRAISGDVNPASVLFALERAGAVKREGDTVTLLRTSYIPSQEAAAGFDILAEDTTDLFEAVQENITGSAEIPNLHRRTMYDNVHPDNLPELRRWLVEEGLALHERAREKIGGCDQDLYPSDSPKPGVKVVLGTFSKIYQGV